MNALKIVLVLWSSWLILWVGSAPADPFLVCDPQAGVDHYNVYQDGVRIGEDVPAQPDGSLHYDLQAIAPGAYDWTAEACNIWGCAITPDPFVSPGAMSAPANLRLGE